MESGRDTIMLQTFYRIGDQVVNVEPDILDTNDRLVKVNCPGRVLANRIEMREGRETQMVRVVFYISEFPYHTVVEIPANYVVQSQLQMR